MIEERSIKSILKSPEKKADIYWFAHINVTDEPYTMEYKVKALAPHDVYHLTFNLGFRIEPRIDFMFRTVMEELRARGELLLDRTPDSKYTLDKGGDHLFMLGDSYLSYDNDLSQGKYILLKFYYLLRKISIKEEKNFGLEISNVLVEKYPLVVSPVTGIWLKREMT
jgi:KUP system potassium uptake protein